MRCIVHHNVAPMFVFTFVLLDFYPSKVDQYDR